MLKGRTESILEASIRHYIETGEPVTSKALFDAYDFGIKPAMIRAELSTLGEEGYLSQNHPSGGRIPTEKAYKFFVERTLQNERAPLPRIPAWTKEAAEALREGDVKSFINEAAKRLGLFGVGYETEESRVYESGMYDLFARLDQAGRDEMLLVARDIESLERRIDEAEEWLLARDIWPQVFVGESPITRSPNLSVIASRFSVGGDPFFFFMIGPTRMDYGKSIQFVKSLEASLKDE
jgi:transcriptional regulator of heat shock response